MTYATPGKFPLYKAEIFGMQPGDFASMLETVINDQAGLLAGRVGSLYASADEEQIKLLTSAEKMLVERELLRLRIIRLVGTVVGGDQVDLRPLEKQRAELLTQSDSLIVTILAGRSVDSGSFSTGVVVSGSGHNIPSFP